MNDPHEDAGNRELPNKLQSHPNYPGRVFDGAGLSPQAGGYPQPVEKRAEPPAEEPAAKPPKQGVTTGTGKKS